MTAVLDSKITGMVRNSRLPWIKPQNKLLMKVGGKESNTDTSGIYVFGGLDEHHRV